MDANAYVENATKAACIAAPLLFGLEEQRKSAMELLEQAELELLRARVNLHCDHAAQWSLRTAHLSFERARKTPVRFSEDRRVVRAELALGFETLTAARRALGMEDV